MAENSQSVVPKVVSNTDATHQELLDWDFVATAPSPKRSGKISCKLNYQGRSKPLAIDSDEAGESSHD